MNKRVLYIAIILTASILAAGCSENGTKPDTTMDSTESHDSRPESVSEDITSPLPSEETTDETECTTESESEHTPSESETVKEDSPDETEPTEESTYIVPITGKNIGETGTSMYAVVTVTGVGTTVVENQELFYVDITIENVSGNVYDMRIRDRFHLMDAKRYRTDVKSFVDDEGESIAGVRLDDGESIEGRALFVIPEGFEVAAFTYTFDFMGFGIFTYIID